MVNIKDIILKQVLRADRADELSLTKTFVSVGALIPSLNNVNNSVLFGRRGTGKTHVFKYLEFLVSSDNDCAIYIDMRTIGSSNSIYSNTNIPLAQRVLSLFSDVIKELHDGITQYIISNEDRKDKYLVQVLPLLERLVNATNRQELFGNVQEEQIMKRGASSQTGITVELSEKPNLEVDASSNSQFESTMVEKKNGSVLRHVDFQKVSSLIKDMSSFMQPHKIWIFIDEYSELNSELQIYLADLLHKVFCPIRNIIIKIAAIEHRTSFCQKTDEGRIGLELGSDANAFSLDEFMVFNNNKVASNVFFRDLLYNHINYSLPSDSKIKNSSDLIKTLFTTETAFLELVNASEGVPRDAFNILEEAVRQNYNDKISINDIRKAAKIWYTSDKLKSVEEYPMASEFLNYVISEVIKNRHARAFLVKTGSYDIINYLYDSRILHIIKRGISSKDTPGVKYDVYSIDYGCYCDLINTKNAPKGLFEAEEEEEKERFVDVPKDDYRSIRRAVLDMDEYEKIHVSSMEK